MQTRDIELQADEGLYTVEGEFVTEHLCVRGELKGPNTRLSDHLNSSTSSVLVRPSGVVRLTTGATIDLAGSHAAISKAHLLFVVPLSEPARPRREENSAWKRTSAKRAWAGLGRYSLSGKVHTEVWRDHRLVLRDLEQKQFLPFTDVTVTYPDCSAREFETVIVNRAHIELLALRD